MSNHIIVERANGELIPEWDCFVASHGEGTLYHSSHWMRTLHDSFNHMEGFFVLVVDKVTGKIVGGLPVYIVKSWILGRRIVSVPFSTWCGPLVMSDSDLDMILAAVIDLKREWKARTVEIRCKADQAKAIGSGWGEGKYWLHHAVDMEGGTDTIWKKLPKKSIRHMIKRSEKLGVVVEEDVSPDGLAVFYDTLVDSRRRLRLPMIPCFYFESILAHLPRDLFTIIVARQNDEVLGAALLLFSGRVCHLELTGEKSPRKVAGAMHLVAWKAMQLGEARGCSEFSFGRSSLGSEGLIAYKRRWGSREEGLSALVYPQPSRGAVVDGTGSSFVRKVFGVGVALLPRSLYLRLGGFVYRHKG